ncbi:MAG: 5-methylcytosine-specific restriction endonuclease system specificity protein McrC [Clostridiales bacterium]|jgi:5-methylcytosine-specific restriction enzyme subunit McrC|nr:5-methylcytosine-specific restriction endonuclease system specificity protein McrC [Clostridiales bacterium]
MNDNHKIKNIYYMLSYAYNSLRENGYEGVASEVFDNIHDLFAAILIHGVNLQIKRGLHRDFISEEAVLPGLRGQIKISETNKKQARIHGKLICEYDEFTENSPHNQVLKSVMCLLLRQGSVKAENKLSLRKLLLYFAGITDIFPAQIRWDMLKYHRNNASYRMLIEICRLTVEGLLLTTETGVHKLASWIDDKKMYDLYERFVLAYYKRHYPELSPRSGHIKWDIADGGKSEYLPIMKPDILLSYGEKTLIIDAKYYENTYQTYHDRTKFISGHLYQIFTYVMNYSKGHFGKVSGVLLYAKTNETITPDEDMVIGGNRFSLKTLDLNQDWYGITKQLNELCECLFSK